MNGNRSKRKQKTGTGAGRIVPQQSVPRDERCHMWRVVQPLGRSPIQTVRRDAHALRNCCGSIASDCCAGDRVHGVRTVHQPRRGATSGTATRTRLREQQLVAADTRIAEHFLVRDAQLLATMPGVNTYIALAIVCRIAPVERFAMVGAWRISWD